ncbi:MAG: HAD-IA family hydrolase [Clostridia bacterium]|nr:HAD-IA family hydrolase [Clostridia bacterium]
MSEKKIPKLVIFDMDGVLVNSEGAFRRACSEALLQWGVNARYDEFQPFTGMGDAKYIGGVSEQYGVPYVEEMTDVSYKLYAEYAPTQLKVFDWSKKILMKLHSEGVKIAIASSAGAYKVDINISCIGVDKSIFSAIVTGSDVEKKKPAPDIFLAAAKMAGEDPENCLVIEDAISGIQAAKAAGMRVATVTSSFTAEELSNAGSDHVTDDLMTVCHRFFEF